MPQRLTPVDILNLRFRRGFRGYAIAEVDTFVRQVADDMETLLTEIATLKERISGIEREMGQYRALENTLRDALVLAQKAADETRSAARAQADSQLQQAAQRVATMESRVDILRQERRRIARDLHAQLTSQIAWLHQEMEDETPTTAVVETSADTIEKVSLRMEETPALMVVGNLETSENEPETA